MPIYGPNEVKTPEEGEKILEEGVYDFLVMGRQQSADPQWGNKAREGRPQDIRPVFPATTASTMLLQRNHKSAVP